MPHEARAGYRRHAPDVITSEPGEITPDARRCRFEPRFMRPATFERTRFDNTMRVMADLADGDMKCRRGQAFMPRASSHADARPRGLYMPRQARLATPIS